MEGKTCLCSVKWLGWPSLKATCLMHFVGSKEDLSSLYPSLYTSLLQQPDFRWCPEHLKKKMLQYSKLHGEPIHNNICLQFSTYWVSTKLYCIVKWLKSTYGAQENLSFIISINIFNNFHNQRLLTAWLVHLTSRLLLSANVFMADFNVLFDLLILCQDKSLQGDKLT